MWLGPSALQIGGWRLTDLTHSSPNFGPRRDGALPDIVVIHYTAMAGADAACRALCNPASQVSAHYLIDRDGAVRSLVAEGQRAWHAGAGQWADVTDVNSRSIGIELDNDGYSPFAAPQIDALCNTLDGILQRWSIPAHRVIGHSDMAPGRKIDPGLRFDWQRLAKLGLSVWPKPVAPGDFAADMARFGYTATTDPDLLLDCFRRRFAPQRIGPLCDADRSEIADLAARFAVDGQTVKA